MKLPWIDKFNDFSICMLVFGFGILIVNYNKM